MAGPKKWKCTVCGYIHEGDEPPDECPVCKQPKDVFVPSTEEYDEPANAAGKPDEETEAKAKAEADAKTEAEAEAATDGDTDTDTEPDAASGPQSSRRQWRCTVCNYIHSGDSPPDICPVCKQPWTKFVPHVEGEEKKAAPNEPADEGEDEGKDKPKDKRKDKRKDKGKDKPKAMVVDADRWRCTICNYMHSGSEPPDVCPICGAGREAFVAETKAPEHHHEGIGGLIEMLHLHPVMAHFPNGSLPLALVAWVAYLILGEPSLERTSLYLMLVAAAAAPVTFFSGYSDARHRFGTTTTGVFPEKKLWSWVLMVVCLGMVGWRLAFGWHRVPSTTLDVAVYTSFLALGTVVVSRLGMLGGKLVFGH